ncbi:uncharacterized protein B0H64DRAFT_403706 [Chaetomium fimeti]|uniref:Uncharacterized protein n=1 Tax=Chaetomium fimeti TaxID=1854472 RepID=A0AAE0HAW8_9PEZI|nr:hypothetical protein B0H64DRAFT_403706 [Chaetomium fimeti]
MPSQHLAWWQRVDGRDLGARIEMRSCRGSIRRWIAEILIQGGNVANRGPCAKPRGTQYVGRKWLAQVGTRLPTPVLVANWARMTCDAKACGYHIPAQVRHLIAYSGPAVEAAFVARNGSLRNPKNGMVKGRGNGRAGRQRRTCHQLNQADSWVGGMFHLSCRTDPRPLSRTASPTNHLLTSPGSLDYATPPPYFRRFSG